MEINAIDRKILGTTPEKSIRKFFSSEFASVIHRKKIHHSQYAFLFFFFIE